MRTSRRHYVTSKLQAEKIKLEDYYLSYKKSSCDKKRQKIFRKLQICHSRLKSFLEKVEPIYKTLESNLWSSVQIIVAVVSDIISDKISNLYVESPTILVDPRTGLYY